MKTQKYGTIAWWREKYVYEENTRIRAADERGRKKVAKKMLEEDVPEEIIIRFTQLTQEELNEVKKEIEPLNKTNEDKKSKQLNWWKEKAVYEENTRISTALNEGRKKAKLEDAKKMKEEKIAIDVIVKITGLSKEEIESL